MMENKRICRPNGIVQNIGDHSYQQWYYNYVPEGMRLASVSDIMYGRLVLHKLVEREGFFTLYVDDQDIEVLQNKIKAGYPVYVKDYSKSNQ